MRIYMILIILLSMIVCCLNAYCLNVNKFTHNYFRNEVLTQLYPVALDILSTQTKNNNDATTYNQLASIGSYTTPSSNLEKIIQELYMSHWNGTNVGYIEREYIYLKSTGIIEKFKNIRLPDTIYFRIATTDFGEQSVIAWNKSSIISHYDYEKKLSYINELPISQTEFKLITDWNTENILDIANRDASVTLPQINITLIRVIVNRPTIKIDYILYQDILDDF